MAQIATQCAPSGNLRCGLINKLVTTGHVMLQCHRTKRRFGAENAAPWLTERNQRVR